jgi:hypothetical protein
MIVAPRRRSRRPNKALIGVAKVLGVHGSQDGVRYGDIVIEGVQRRYVFDRFSGYYNEFDRQKAAWLRNLIEEGEVAHGVVDERSIEEVQPDDLAGFTSATSSPASGSGASACRRAGWPDDRPVWTGSCPCGPFSIAGKQEGFEDPRHLWPQWFRLIGRAPASRALWRAV